MVLSMNIRNLTLAVATVLSAGFAQSSFAATPATAVTGTALANLQAAVPSVLSAYTAPTGATASNVVVINISGASVQDKAVQAILQNDILQAGTLKIFKDSYASNGNTGTSSTADWGGRWTTFVGTTGSVNQNGGTLPAGLANKTLVVNKRGAGGAGWGAIPLAEGIPINFLNVAAALTSGATVYQDTTQSVPTYGVYAAEANGGQNPGIDTFQAVPDAGLLDTNPELQFRQNTPQDLQQAITPQDISQLKKHITSQFTYGIPVSLGLFNALQAAQGLTVSANYGSALGKDDYTPTLSRNQVAALISGQIQTWDQLLINGQSLIQAAGNAAPADHLVHVFQRIPGAGAPTLLNAYFLNQPYSPNAAALAVDNSPIGPAVNIIDGNAEEETAFDDLANGTQIVNDYVNQTPVNPTSGNKGWAIGVLSADRNANNSLTTAYSHNYRFVKIDGYTPTIKNVFNGTYGFYGQNVWLTSTSNTSHASSAAQAALNYFIGQGSLANVIASANVKQAFGDQAGNNTGYLGLVVNNPTSTTVSYSLTSPVSPWFFPNGDNSAVPVPYLPTSNNLDLIFQ